MSTEITSEDLRLLLVRRAEYRRARAAYFAARRELLLRLASGVATAESDLPDFQVDYDDDARGLLLRLVIDGEEA